MLVLTYMLVVHLHPRLIFYQCGRSTILARDPDFNEASTQTHDGELRCIPMVVLGKIVFRTDIPGTGEGGEDDIATPMVVLTSWAP